MPTVTVIQPTIAEEKAVKIRCAAYCRVSSDSEDQLNSFMAQTRYYSHFFEDSETDKPLCPKYKGLSEKRQRTEIAGNYDIF